MASVQINFYLMPNEQASFDELLKSAGPIRVVTGMNSAFRPQLSSTTVLRSFGAEDLKVHLVREEDVDLLRAGETPNGSEWFVDVLRSPVIEYWRCFTDGKILRRGRLYLIEDYYDDNGILVKKDTGFLKWARAVIAKVRRNMSKREDGDYISHAAAERDPRIQLTAR
jgi:hypothetical protein